MPQWLTQSGERNETVYYSQGMGLWLNYTEHVGDANFEPGNSLWVPPQESGADTYSWQCAAQQTFCAEAVGELHKQYCQVMEAYCGIAMTLLQLLLSMMAGVGVVVVIWSIHLITTTHCTIADSYLVHLCVSNGVGSLAAVIVWYLFVFRFIINSTFYQDQYNRCSQNDAGRNCWQIGICVYFVIAGGVLYPVLAVLVLLHVSNKSRQFQKLLSQMYETTVVVETAPPVVDMKSHVLNEEAKTVGVVLEARKFANATRLAPLKQPSSSAVSSLGAFEEDSRDRAKRGDVSSTK
ncbi:unnamed protein product [Hyaloperonospora brassicae]|uniref:Uncharacterized protein n=1 Tax=Hyaloperonospora brassicae TaxID=162125 RepID=A0AAV0T1Q9_HYABA|nr:unnamed protein product [Hyaloperonospora brassicae]